MEEKRTLITIDHDLGNVLAYRHGDTAGVAVINPPGRATLPLLRLLVRTLLEALKKDNIQGRLRIVEPGRIRAHDAQEIPGREKSE